MCCFSAEVSTRYLSISNSNESCSNGQVLTRVYPDHGWIKSKFSVKGPKKSTQRRLRVVVSELFPDRGTHLVAHEIHTVSDIG